MIFITSSVFLEIKNHFPACGEKCLKQDASWYSPVMVIVRKADFYNKKRTNTRAHFWVRVFVLLFVVGAYAPNDHDLYSLYERPASSFRSMHKWKVIWPIEKQEGITNLHEQMKFLRCICSDNFAQHIFNPQANIISMKCSKKTAARPRLGHGKFW